MARVWAFISPPQSPQRKLNHIGCLRLQHSQSDGPIFIGGCVARYWINHIYLSLAVHNRDVSACCPFHPESIRYVGAHNGFIANKYECKIKHEVWAKWRATQYFISKSHGPDDAPAQEMEETIYNNRKSPFADALRAWWDSREAFQRAKGLRYICI